MAMINGFDLTNHQIRLIQELTGIEYNKDKAIRKFQSICVKYKVSPDNLLRTMEEDFSTYSKAVKKDVS